MFKFMKDALQRPTPSRSTIKRASLLGLPLELRERIYALVIPCGGFVEPDPGANGVVSIRGNTTAEFILVPPLAQVNQRLRQECAKYFFGHNTFVVAFNRYFREYGRWLWKVEPLWIYLTDVVLQLDSPATRARKEQGEMLDAKVKCEDGGRRVRLYANLSLRPEDHRQITQELKEVAGSGRGALLDGRCLVVIVRWLVDHVFVGELVPSKGSAKAEWDVRTIITSQT